MQPEPISVSHNVPHPQTAFDTNTPSQHGQRRSHDLQGSLQHHSGELYREPEPPATRPEDTSNQVSSVEADGLKVVASPSPPPRDRITEYENALANSPRKPGDGPLFEVIKSNAKPGDKSTPIAKLPNGVYIPVHITVHAETD